MRVKHWNVISILSAAILGLGSTLDRFPDKPIYIQPSIQRSGNPEAGYNYLITGNFLKSGLPYDYFTIINGKDRHNYLQRTGKNAKVPPGFNVVKSENGIDVVIPTCLQCHSQMLNKSLVVGLGNTMLDFTAFRKRGGLKQKLATGVMHTLSPRHYQATEDILRAFSAVGEYMQTATRGVNAADRLATLLVAHRDPQTLAWQQQPLLDIPNEVVPTDVPAWWLLKKKNAMFYNGFGRGDFGRFLMLSNILTVKDSSEAREVFSHFGDVLAYIRSIQPPKYPLPIDGNLAQEGEQIFTNTCSRCHGTYGYTSTYPNLLIPESIIQTDSLLFSSNYQNPQFINWFNKSWFATGDLPARLEPYNGYIAPPLDGIWATAPYLHNGSVPNLEAVINSSARPRYWKRDFKRPVYNAEKMQWNFQVVVGPGGNNVYNTTLKGYSNSGHYFGDKLTEKERKAVLEYLKTL